MDQGLNTSRGKHWATLPVLYALAQFVLLHIYLNQNHLYDYLYKHKDRWGTPIILQMHSFVTSSTYIVQWISMWTIWDRYTSQDWLLMLIVSIAALLAVIALMGHPCDLVCAPFILSYDSIEYNIRIGSPFLTEKSKRRTFERFESFTGVLFQMNEYVAHLLNYIFYEYVLSLLAILAWRGSYTLLDVFLYPENPNMSVGMCLCLGYPLYFLLMYTQAYSDKLRFLPSFIFLNYPSLVQNLRHLAAFFTCILLWRGFWLLFDTHIGAMALAVRSPYLFYLGWMFLSFLVLSLLKTASSINGPMSHMCDYYDLFPHYPNSYLAVLFRSTSDTDEVSSDSSKNTSLDPYSVAFLEWNNKKEVFLYRTLYFNRNISSRSCFSFESNCAFFLLTIWMSDKCGVCSFKTCFVFHGRKHAYRTNRGHIGLHGDMSRFSQTRIGSIINVANGLIADRVI